MNTTWKILSIKADGEFIQQATYHARAAEGDAAVETQGNWFFQHQKPSIPFKDVTEQNIIDWIKSESNGIIEARMAQQLKNLAAQKSTPLPWMPQVFTPEL